jgi:RNA polymerase sigma factor
MVIDDQVIAQTELTVMVQAAQTDKRALNTLLRNFMPFIKKCVAGVFFKGQSKADNLTDAMLAFSHSVQTYNPEQGTFISYAATVIRNRLLDSARKELSTQKQIRFFSAKADDKIPVWEPDVSLQEYHRSEEERNLRVEIETANSEFAQWGFSWAALLKNCPRQDRSRRIASRIAKAVRQDSAMLSDTLKNRQLPVSRLAETFPRKALEKYRQYIVALIILTQGDYPYICSFVPQHFAEEETV